MTGIWWNGELSVLCFSRFFSLIADSLRTAASYFGVWLPCHAGGHDEELSRCTLSFDGKLAQPAVKNLAILAKARYGVTVGLLMAPFPASLLSVLLAVWKCGACPIVLPYPDTANLAVVTGSERAGVADSAVHFSKGGMTLVAYSADSMVEGNVGIGVYNSGCSPNIMQSPYFAKKNTQKCRSPDAFLRQWEYYLTESGCQLLVASAEVAPAAAVLSAKLSIPMCIIRFSGEESEGVQRQKKFSAVGEDRGSAHVSAYVREVPYSTRKISTNITRWKVLEEEHIKTMQKEYEATLAGCEGPRAAMLFYENSGVHSPKVVVYTHEALEGQVSRNKQLLELTPADAVLLFAPDPAADCPPLCSAVSGRTVNPVAGRLWSHGRMTCAPKGLLTVALPAFAAGASLSIVTSPVTGCISELKLSGVRNQRISSKLSDRCIEFRAQISHENVKTPAGRKRGHLPDRNSSTSASECLKGVQLWEAFACMQVHKPGEATMITCDGLARSSRQMNDSAKKADLGEVSVLAMDLRTAAAMLAALQLEEEGLRYPTPENTLDDRTDWDAAADGIRVARRDRCRTTNSTSDSQRSIPGEHFLPREYARRYLGAAEALRLVCICTDEEDLEEHLNCALGGRVRRSTGVTHANTVIHGWQQLASPRVKVLHLCSLTQVGLVFYDDGRRTKCLTKNAGTVETGYITFGEKPEVSRRRLPAGENIETTSGGRCEQDPATLGGIVPNDVKAVIDSDTGLLKIRSPYGATGYYNRPRSTAEAFGTQGEFHSTFRGFVVSDKSNAVTPSCSSPLVDHHIVLQTSLHPASVPQVPLLYRLVRRPRRGPKMERHIEGWVKKRPIAGRDWCNLHVSKRYRKQMFR